jgi:amino acid adenylation domain-containing protein
MLQKEKKDLSARHAQLSKAKRALLEKRLRGEQASSSEALTIPRRPQRGPVPLSFVQRGLWFLDQLVADSPLYNIPAALRLSGPLNTTALHQSLNALVQRHEVLRTTFVAVDGHPMQVIAPVFTVPLPVVDLSALPDAERQAEALRLANEEVQRSFDLTKGPLMRALLLQLGAEEHILLLPIHHIISDGWSLGVLYQELATLYTAFASGTPSPLPDLPIQYADFALWQQEQLQGEAYAEQLAYWKQQLAGAPTVLDLPADRPRPAVPTYRGSVHLVTLPPGLTEALKALSRREAVTLHMTLVAAFQALLYRYTGQDDMVIGSVAAGRTQAELEALIGFFVNTPVLRTDLSGNPTFRELLGRVREVTLEAQAHQEVPFESLVRELQPIRSLGQNPLFQVMLILAPPSPTLPAGWEPAKMVVETGTAKCDLYLDLAERPEGLLCRWEYSTDLFDAATIARMAGHWQTLVEGVVADPTRRLSELPLLTEKERHQLLVEWNATQAAYPEDQCIHQLFEAQVERTPDAVAVVFGDEHLTYRELNSRANQLAHYLQVQGVGPEVRIGICVERSMAMIVGALGILKAGGTYVPLDPAYPEQRLAFMLEDTQMPVLLTQQHLVEGLGPHEKKVICLDTAWKFIAQESEENTLSGALPENLAYIIYTSGSAGKPKGVMISHKSLVNAYTAWEGAYQLRSLATCHLQMANFAFDVCTGDMVRALCSGGKLVLCPQELLSDPEQLYALMCREQVNSAEFVPVVLRNMIQYLRETGLSLNFMRLLVVGSDIWYGKEHQHLQEVCGPGTRVINSYGVTEATIDSAYFEAPLGKLEENALTPIGRPFANTQMYILDTHLQPVPIGVPGELYIGGLGLSRGYLNRPELTAERFIPNPFSDEPGARLYKTGDLARYRPDGNIEFLGRIDHQVKIRGFRIELGEIEEVLRQHPAVRQAVVVVREDRPGDKRLVAYVVPAQGEKLAIKNLHSFLKERVPEYMVPTSFMILDALPLTPNGKIDRRALPAPESTRFTEEETFVAPTSMLHHQLITIWEELLDVRPIGISDNFFYLGGHSLLAARLVKRIEHVFGKRIALSTLFSGPTIEQLAEALQQQGKSDARTSILPVQAGGSRQPFFFLHGDWTGGAFYCFAVARALGPDQPFYVLEPYKFGGLQSLPSLETVVAAHIEVLRAIQPEGPYLLGGFCNGGLLVYEMARQLQEAGERIDFLALITPSAPVRFKAIHAISKRMSKLPGLGVDMQAQLFLRVRHAFRHVYRTLRPSGRRVQDFGKLLTIDPRLERMFPPVEALCNDYVSVFSWMVLRHETGVYPGKITFYWPDEEPFGEKTWLPVIKAKAGEEIERHIVPGTHMSCVTEHVQDLAACLSSCLSRVQEETVNQPGGATNDNAPVKPYSRKDPTHARAATIS